MGSGKSTLGRKLAKKLGLQFVDMDHYIEQRNYKTVPQIFEEEGEEVFRKKERQALEELAEFTDLVIATGGGAPCFFDNIDLMNRTGKTIYLDVPSKTLAYRLKQSKTERPLITGKNEAELIRFIDESLNKRNPFYRQAQFKIKNPDTNLNDLVKLLQ